MVNARVDEFFYTGNAESHRPTGGPDLDTLAGEILLIIRIEKSFRFSKCLLAIIIDAHAVLQNRLERLRIAPLLDQQFA